MPSQFSSTQCCAALLHAATCGAVSSPHDARTGLAKWVLHATSLAPSRHAGGANGIFHAKQGATYMDLNAAASHLLITSRHPSSQLFIHA